MNQLYSETTVTVLMVVIAVLVFLLINYFLEAKRLRRITDEQEGNIQILQGKLSVAGDVTLSRKEAIKSLRVAHRDQLEKLYINYVQLTALYHNKHRNDVKNKDYMDSLLDIKKEHQRLLEYANTAVRK